MSAANYASPSYLESPSHLRVAFVHDNFLQAGGAERVAEVIARSLPGAHLFSTAVLRDKLSAYLKTRPIRDTFLRRVPGLRRYYRHYFLLYPLAVLSIPLSTYDLVITSCCGFAKMARARRDAVHICYCHTPTRWIWRFDDYAAREGFSSLTKSILKIMVKFLRAVDLRAAGNPDFFLANSKNVADRIRQFYGRDSVILHPPIDCSRFNVSYESQGYYLIVSRLVAYKRIDLAIAACEAAGRHLVIIGDGPDRKRLESLAGPNTTLKGRLSDTEVADALGNCRALLFPGEEDFGMTPLEANAAGKPCIAYRSGGALDSVIDGRTGVLFPDPSAESLIAALHRAEQIELNPSELRSHAMRFDTSVFVERFLSLVSSMAGQKKARTTEMAAIPQQQNAA